MTMAAAMLLLAAASAAAADYKTGASLYRSGEYRAAVGVLKPLAEQGDVLAQFAIGAMYDDGRGLPQDFSLALKWYKKAAQAGLVDAQYMVGRFYGGGRGVKQNPSAAFFWFNLAASGGYPRAASLRDQHGLQITPAQRRRKEAEAATWQTRHPRQIICSFQRCIYPGWLPRPRWNFLYPQDIQPR